MCSAIHDEEINPYLQSPINSNDESDVIGGQTHGGKHYHHGYESSLWDSSCTDAGRSGGDAERTDRGAECVQVFTKGACDLSELKQLKGTLQIHLLHTKQEENRSTEVKVPARLLIHILPVKLFVEKRKKKLDRPAMPSNSWPAMIDTCSLEVFRFFFFFSKNCLQ